MLATVAGAVAVGAAWLDWRRAIRFARSEIWIEEVDVVATFAWFLGLSFFEVVDLVVVFLPLPTRAAYAALAAIS